MMVVEMGSMPLGACPAQCGQHGMLALRADKGHDLGQVRGQPGGAGRRGRAQERLRGFAQGHEFLLHRVMQLVVVALMLAPLCVPACTRGYPPLRVTAAGLTAIAPTGW